MRANVKLRFQAGARGLKGDQGDPAVIDYASKPEAEAGADPDKVMSPLTTAQQVDARLADETTPDADAQKLSTPSDAIRRLFSRVMKPLSAMTSYVSNDALLRAMGWNAVGDSGIERLYWPETSEPSWFRKKLLGDKWFRGSEQSPRITIGQEYLTRIYEDIELSANGGGGTFIKIALAGNSIMARGVEGASTVEIFSRILADKGFSQFAITNYAVSGTRWSQLDVNQLGLAPDVAAIFILFDTNDINYHTPDELYAVMSSKIAEIRAAHGDVNKLSIIVIGGPSTNAKDANDQYSRDYRKYEQLRRGKEKLCREHQVCFVDLYNWMPDSRWMATTDMDDQPPAYNSTIPMSGNPVHPKHKLAVRHFGKVLDEVMPRSAIAAWASNRVLNVPGSAGVIGGSAAPGNFNKGWSFYRTTIGSILDGMLATLRHADSTALQINTGYQTGAWFLKLRTADVPNNGWHPWSGTASAIDLYNGWVPYGAGSPSPYAWFETSGTVHIQMHIKSGSVTVGTQIATLPGMLRPSNQEVKVIGTKRIRIWPSGAITLDSDDWTNENVCISTSFLAA